MKWKRKPPHHHSENVFVNPTDAAVESAARPMGRARHPATLSHMDRPPAPNRALRLVVPTSLAPGCLLRIAYSKQLREAGSRDLWTILNVDPILDVLWLHGARCSSKITVAGPYNLFGDALPSLLMHPSSPRSPRRRRDKSHLPQPSQILVYLIMDCVLLNFSLSLYYFYLLCLPFLPSSSNFISSRFPELHVSDSVYSTFNIQNLNISTFSTN